MTTRSTTRGIILAAALAFFSFQTSIPAAAEDKLDALFPDPVVAKGKGFEIKRSALEDVYLNYKTEMAQRKQYLPDSARVEVQSNLLHHLILSKILAQKATAEETTRTREQVAKDLDDYRKSAPSEEVFQAELKASGSTLEQIKARSLEEQLGKVVLIRELVSSNAVSDEAIKKFYDGNPDRFVVPEQVRIAQILLATEDPATKTPLTDTQKKDKEKLAKDIKARADKGEDFAKLVKQYSDDAASTNRGGEYPPFARGMMAPQFEAIEAAAFTLKTNQISDPVETKFGYHILKLLEKIPPSTMELAKISPKIKDYLINEEIKRLLPAYQTKAEADYEVKTFAVDGPPVPLLPPSTTPATLPSPGQK